MAVPMKRYEDARQAYFLERAPPLPPKQDQLRNANVHQLNLEGSRRHSNPSYSPQHSSDGGTYSELRDYTEYSHSVPRSHNRGNKKVHDNYGRAKEQTKSPISAKPLIAHVHRSSSFTSGIMAEQRGEDPDMPLVPPHHSSATRCATDLKTMFKKDRPAFITDEMSLTELINRHQKSFPVRIYVTNGYLGATSRLTISTGDRYNVHFVKRTRVMHLKDNHGTPYSIPLNSAIEFGLLYEPKEGRKPANLEQGMVFPALTDILAQPEIPRVISPLKSWSSDDDKTSLLSNEVLIIKSSHRSVFKKKGLKVYSITTKSDKFIPEDCKAEFTTDPSCCRLHVSDIVDHIKNHKGCHCVLFFNSKVLLNREMSTPGQDFPEELFQMVLTVVDQTTETSVIASSLLCREQVSEEDYDPDRDVLIDIPVDDNTALVGVALIEINDKTETEKLYEDTRCLFEAFDPSKVLSVKDSGSENAYVAQKLLYTTIRRGCESLGVELDRPQAVYDSTQLHKTSPQVFPPTPPASTSSPLALHKLTYSKMQPSPPQVQPVRSLADLEDSDSSSEYDEIRPGALKLFHGSIPGSARVKNMDATRKENNPSRHPQLASSPSQRFSLPSSQFLPPSQVAAPLEARVSSMEAQLAVLGRGTKRQAAMEQEMIRMKTTVEKLLPQIYALQSKLYQLTKISQPSVPSKTEQSSAPASEGVSDVEPEDEKITAERNIRQLRTFSIHQVGELLDAMELSQHKASFLCECISGEILLECDDDILKDELGVMSRLHRLRIAKVIQGRHSAVSIVEGTDPYVSLQAP